MKIKALLIILATLGLGVAGWMYSAQQQATMKLVIGATGGTDGTAGLKAVNLLRPSSSNVSESMRTMAVLLSHFAFALRAAGFMATRRSQKSPGVVMCSLPICT